MSSVCMFFIHGDDELKSKSLADNNTWELVSIPEGRKVIDNRWVYRVKLTTDGAVDKFKARLVARGFTQEAGIDFTETIQHLWCCAQFSCQREAQLGTFRCENGILYGDLDEVIYMKQPTVTLCRPT
jgi:hypothetical protein